MASYVPGTEANRQSRAEHGQDPNTYRSGSGNTGSNTGGGIMSYIPGTEANRESRALNGQDSNYGSGNNQGYTGTGSNQGVGNTGGGVASYIPGTQANRESRAMHGQDPSTYSSGNTGSNTGTFCPRLQTVDTCTDESDACCAHEKAVPLSVIQMKASSSHFSSDYAEEQHTQEMCYCSASLPH